jgi:hypothetical protein
MSTVTGTQLSCAMLKMVPVILKKALVYFKVPIPKQAQTCYSDIIPYMVPEFLELKILLPTLEMLLNF